MILGENLMNELNLSDERKLKFEYEQTDETILLQSLKVKPIGLNLNLNLSQEDLNMNLDADNHDQTTEKVLFANKSLNLKITQSVQDSDDDDDLIPYDTSNDVTLSSAKQPAYLRDCLDALIFSDDPEKIEASIKSVDKLCDSFHFELEEICVELLRVLLHKSNQYSILDFDDLKMLAMISITCHYPKECAEYLTSQFYQQGYTLTQRTDILHVLCVSIQRLSSPNQDPIFDRRLFLSQSQADDTISNLIPFNKSKTTTESNWRQIVEQRIAQNTKIKSKSTTATKSKFKTKPNKFSDIYGYFFFPLLRPYDSTRVHLNLIEEDFMLLGKLVFSLGVILFSSINTTVIENMTLALTDFLWAIKNHVEPFVRKSVLFSFTLIVMVISNDLLFSSLNSYFVELKYWLESIIINDSNGECQKKAFECLNILRQRVKGQLTKMENC
jgi:telomere length regulation protein